MRQVLAIFLVLAAVITGCGSSDDEGTGGGGGADVKKVALGEKTLFTSLTVGAGALWIGVDGKLLEADPVSGKVRRRIKLPFDGSPTYMTVDDKTVWLVIFTRAKERLVGVDIKSGKVKGKPFEIPFPFPIEIVATNGYVWLVSNLKGQRNLHRYDPKAGRITKRIPDAGNKGLAGDADGLWLTSDDGLVKVDPATAKVVGGPYETAPDTSTVVVGGGLVWTSTAIGEVGRHDPETGEAFGDYVDVVRGSGTLASGPLGTWMADLVGHQIIRLDPKTGRPAETVKDVRTQKLAVGNKAIYAVVAGDESFIFVVTPRQ